MKRLIRITALLLIFVLFFAVGIYTSWRTFHGSTDFDTYYWAARDILSGRPIYFERDGVSPYIYPPFFACAMVPFTVFSMEISSFFWYALTVLLFLLTLLFSFLIFLKGKNIKKVAKEFPLLPKILFLTVVIILFLDNIAMLQVNIIMVFSVLAGLYSFSRKRDILAGFFFAFAISIKIIPILFLIYFLLKREWKTSCFIVFWLIVLSFLVPALFMGFGDAWWSLIRWNEKMMITSTSFIPNDEMMCAMFNPENQSVTAFLFRWLAKNDFLTLHLKRIDHEFYTFILGWTLSLPKQYILYLSKFFIALIAIATYLVSMRRTKTRQEAFLQYEYSLVLLACLIANPILRTQHFIFIIPPLLFMLCHVTPKARDFKAAYTYFIVFSALYLLQGIRIFKIFGSGALSILLMWGFLFTEYIKKRKVIH